MYWEFNTYKRQGGRDRPGPPKKVTRDAGLTKLWLAWRSALEGVVCGLQRAALEEHDGASGFCSAG